MKKYAITGILAAIIGIAGLAVSERPASEGLTMVSESLTALSGAAQAQEAQEDVEIVEMAIGAEDAPVTVIEYASFTCPHCANFSNEVFPKLKSEYIDTGKVRLVNREVYFDPYGLWAGMVARCGGEEKYFGISKMLYAELGEWLDDPQDQAGTVANLTTIGKKAGLSEDEVRACLSDEAHARALVAEYKKNATADDINSTPTFIINGEKYSNMPWEDMKEILDEAAEG